MAVKKTGMGKNRNFIIPFVGLSAGKHLYSYKIEDSFFEQIDHSEIKKATLLLELTLNKQSEMLVLDFAISGTVNVSCDRCNEPFDLEVSGNNQLVVKTGGAVSSDEDVLCIAGTESEIDISGYAYEYIVLSLPIKRVHPDNEKGESTCDKEAMKVYNKYVQQEKEKTADPRWEKLKGLIN